MENPGIDPGTSRMQSGRSTIWANPPSIYEHGEFSYKKSIDYIALLKQGFTLLLMKLPESFFSL